jgi:amino acid transporter
MVMAALGEMAAWLPMGSGFTGYAHRFVDPALGFAMGWTYWFKYIIVTPNNLTAFALVIQYWKKPEDVNPGVFIAVSLVCIVLINYFGINFFGEFEFWLSSIKVVVILGLILVSLILACGGGPGDGGAPGFKYWHDPGAFASYIHQNSASGRFLAFWSVLTTAVFAYLGIELVGVTVGEAQNPRKVIPRAIRLTFYRILLFYVILVFFLGMILPYNDPELKKAVSAGTSAAASPFVVAIQQAGIPVLPAILNACILLFVFSAANSDLYIASRTLYGLALEGNAPELFSRTDRRGVPIYALGLSSLFCCLAFMNVSTSSQTVFKYFVNLVTIFGLLTWISILVSHIWFVRARRAQNIPDTAMAFVAPGGKWGSIASLCFCILIAIFKGFDYFVHGSAVGKTYGSWDYKNFITAYLGIPLYLIMIAGYKLLMKSKGVKPETADLYSGKAKIDEEEAEFLAREAIRKNGKEDTKWGGLYKRSIGAIF